MDKKYDVDDQTAALKVFDVEKQKAVALNALPQRGRTSPAFKQFYKSELCDSYLCAVLDHFAALIRVEELAKARMSEKSGNPPPPSEEELHAAGMLESTMKEVSTYYCYTVMKFSRYQAAQQDRIFFESLYEFITLVVCAAFAPEHKVRIENEMHRILRSNTFNLMARKNDSNHHSKKNYSSRELYALRYAGDGTTGRKLLTMLHPRRSKADSVSNALSRRSPLASLLLPQSTHDTDSIVSSDLLSSCAVRTVKERQTRSCSPTVRSQLQNLSLNCSSPGPFRSEKPLPRRVPFETI